MEIVSFPEEQVPPELCAQVHALRARVWPDDVDVPGPIHDPALRPVSMLLLLDGRVVTALDVLSKELVHAGSRYAASGLSAVVTAEAHRGEGYGTALVEAARNAIEESEADLGIFTCDRQLQRFYERAGWNVLHGTVLVGGTREDPFPSDRLGKVTLARFFSRRAREAAEGFAGARIELYPGGIDRLW